jgi:hypothetical protein
MLSLPFFIILESSLRVSDSEVVVVVAITQKEQKQSSG